MKLIEKKKAINLRNKGLSYNKILAEIKVSKSTLSYWLRDVELNKTANINLLRGRELSRKVAAKSKIEKRQLDTERTIASGIEEFNKLSRNLLFLSGLNLYWAEGDKHKQEKVKFTNSDPKMIALMMRWFREVCEVPEEKFRIALHVHNLHVVRNIRQYWCKVTGISLRQFHKVYVKRSTLHFKRNALYNGTCAIVVHDKKLFRRICGWKVGLVTHFNISP